MTTFHTDCTIPPSNVNYVTPPNTRGTLQILWSCLATLILCTWTIQHLNVPPQSRPQSIQRRLRRLATKLKWMLITLLAPEFVVGLAISDYRSATSLAPQFKCFAEEDGVEWTVAHCFLANMGGFEIQFPDHDFEEQNDLRHNDPREHPQDREGQIAQSMDETRPLNAVGQGSSLLNLARTIEDNLHYVAPLTARPGDEAGSSSATIQGDYISGVAKANGDSSDHTAGKNNSVQNKSLDQRIGKTRITSSCEIPKPELEWTRVILGSIELVQQYPSPQAVTDQLAIGQGEWRFNAQNERLVKSAFHILSESQFPTKRAEEMYDDNPQECIENLHVLRGHHWILDATQLLLARELRIIASLPSLSNDQIEDRSKGDFFTKGLAVIQVLWLAVQVISRGSNDHTISQLEIAVLAFSACACAIYIMYWQKPQGVNTTVSVPASRFATANEMIRLAAERPYSLFSRTTPWIPNNSNHRYGHNDHDPALLFSFGCIIGATIFGGLHCAAWNFQFPSSTERLLWRIAALMCTCLPLLVVLGTGIVMRLQDSFELLVVDWDWNSIIMGFFYSYLVARIYIMVEVFRTLCFLPPEAFRTTWSTNVPHIG